MPSTEGLYGGCKRQQYSGFGFSHLSDGGKMAE